MSLESLDKQTLFRVLVEDFAVDVKPTDSKKVLLAAAAEDGVTWEMYKQAYPDTEVDEVSSVVETPAVVVGDPAGAVAEEVPAAAPVVRTKSEEVNASSADMYLIKMDRENPYFEFRGYKFTSDHPYVVMPAADADKILKSETGFSIATPSEANEYYGR